MTILSIIESFYAKTVKHDKVAGRHTMMITSKMKRHIRHELSTAGPTVWVGKGGSTVQIVNEISRQLDQHEMVKAKFLQTALKDTSAKEIAEQIAKETGSILVEVRGHTFILYRRKRKKTSVA